MAKKENTYFAHGEDIARVVIFDRLRAKADQANIAMGMVSRAGRALRMLSGPKEAARLMYALADTFAAEGAASEELTKKTNNIDRSRKPS